MLPRNNMLNVDTHLLTKFGLGVAGALLGSCLLVTGVNADATPTQSTQQSAQQTEQVVNNSDSNNSTNTLSVQPSVQNNNQELAQSEVQTPQQNGQGQQNQQQQSESYLRQIEVIDPDGNSHVTNQVATVSRNVETNPNTGQVNYGPWSHAQWDSFTPPYYSGYTPSWGQIPEITISNDYHNQHVVIYYTPNPQVAHVYYVDSQTGKRISTDLLAGATGELVNVNLYIPNGYKLSSNQNVPDKYFFIDHDNQDLTVYVTKLTAGDVTPDGKIVGGVPAGQSQQVGNNQANVQVANGNQLTGVQSSVQSPTTEFTNSGQESTQSVITGSKVVNNNGSISGTNQVQNQSQLSQLPQTGNDSANAITLSGLLLSALAMSFGFGLKCKGE